MIFFILPIILIGITVAVLRFNTEWKATKKVTSQFNGPTPEFIFGNVRMIKKNPIDVFKFFTEIPILFGKIAVFHRMFNFWSILITDLDDVEKIMTNTKATRKGNGYNALKPWLGTGLLTSFGKKWQTRRKILTPSFHFNILDQYIEVFNRQTDVLINDLRKNAGGGKFDLYQYITLCALDIICETSMGVKINFQKDDNSGYLKALKELSELTLKRNFSALRNFPLIYDYTPNGFAESKNIKILHKFTNDIIMERRKKILADGTTSEVNEISTYDFGMKKRMSLLDLLLNSTIDGQPLSNEDIREEVDTFMFEGHDTTTAGMTLLLHRLAREPDIQQKAYEDVVNVVGDRSDFTQKDLNSMKYLECVVKEGLRLYPPVPLIGRCTIDKFDIGGIDIPIGTDIAISIYNIHRDPDNYKDPEIFDPDRFSFEGNKNRHPYSYIPFSAGFRNCIGQKFAMLETKVTIAKFLLNYKLIRAEDSDLILQGDLILKSAMGVYVKIVRR